MKRVLLTAALLFVPLALLGTESEEPRDELRLVLNRLDLSAWDRWFVEQNPYLPFVPSDFLAEAALNGTVSADAEGIADRLLSAVRNEWQPYGNKLLLYCGFGVLCAIASALETPNRSALPGGVLKLLGGCLVLGAAAPAAADAANRLRLLKSGTEALLPPILGFFALVDASAGQAALSEGLSALTDGMIALVSDWIVPLSITGGVLHALDGVSRDRFSEIGNLCFRAGRWLLRLGSSLYLCVSAVRGSVAAKADSLLLSTARLMAGSLPYVGGMLSGSADTVLKCLALVRSLLGWTGMLVLILAMLRPVLSLLMEYAAMKLAALLLRSFAPSGFADILSKTAGMLGLLTASTVTVLLLVAGYVGLVMGAFGA